MIFSSKRQNYYTNLSIYLNVQNKVLDLKLLIILCISVISTEIYAQLGFCQGNSGDPIFTETFGTGLQDSPLPFGTTTYTYANGAEPNDGLYTVTSNTSYFDWFSINDHTPNDVNGRMLLVNSDFNAGEFYRTTINGLCENTTYEFSSWLVNLTPSNGFCGNTQIPINVSFEIWDSTDTNQLASGTTGNIFGTTSPNWNQFALVFQTIPAQTSVILKMINNSSGGCGNDLAIDDIVFKSCGDSINVEDSGNGNMVSLCSTQTPYSDSITAVPDNAVFSTHFYQWQSSTDGINWLDLPGEIMDNLNINGITTTTFFRAKVAEFPTNLNNEDCLTFSDVYEINIVQAPAQPTIQCWETATFDDNLCNWIVTGTQPIQPNIECWETATFNNNTCTWDITGTQPAQPPLECWETATFNNTICIWQVTGTQPTQPTLECWETATFNNISCVWEVSGNQPAQPNNLECWETTTFNTTTCSWEIAGTQPAQPTIACWETATFNNTTCTWEVTGSQPSAPTALECWESTSFNNTSCSWEITGTQPLQPTDLECWQTTTFNEVNCSWEINGTQPQEPTGLECWESTTFNDTSCSWEVSGSQPIAPTDLECWQTTQFNNDTCQWDILGTQPIVFRDEFRDICENEVVLLDPNSTIANATYQWDTGEMTPTLDIEDSGIYIVEVTDGCFTEIITFNVIGIEPPVIESIETMGSVIVVNLVNNGDYLYSLNGVDYQFSNRFPNRPSNLYTVYVKSPQCDDVVTQDHYHFYIQKFMTPNADGDNDFFSLNLAEFFLSSEVYIFDRYGKLLFSAKNTNVNWDGTFKGNPLPTSDYWYRIILDGKEVKGHFTLKH